MRKSPRSALGQKTRLSELLRDYRIENKLKQVELQDRLHWDSPGYISKIETGLIMTPDPDFLRALAQEMSIPVKDLESLSRTPAEEEDSDLWRSRSSSSSQKFKLIFGHSLWGAPIFHATHEGRLPEFAVTSFAKTNSSGIVSGGELAWIEPRKSSPTPGPGNNDLAALSAGDVLSLLRQGEADIGAIPGNIVPDNAFIRIGTIVDSAAGCTFVCDYSKLKKWQEAGLIFHQASDRRQHKEIDDTEIIAVGSRELYTILRNENKETKGGVRIGVEEDTIAHEFLKDICQQDKGGTLTVNDVNWLFRTSDLAKKGFEELKKECKKDHSNAELIGVIVWEPHATWMTMLQSQPQLKRIPLNFTPNELGRPHHLSYELVIRENRIGRMNTREQELRAALSDLLFEVWDSAERLNALRKDIINQATIERLAYYYGFANDRSDVDSKAMKRTLDAVGSILYSVRLSVKGHNLLTREIYNR